MKKLFVVMLVLGTMNAFAEVECKTINSEGQADKITQNHLNNFCDIAQPFSISDLCYTEPRYGSTVFKTRVCCTKKASNQHAGLEN